MNAMQLIRALSLAPDVNEWLTTSCQPRILHVFDRACNLINERREVLSIVTPQIGNGPFNLVIPRLRKSAERHPDPGASWQTSEVSFSHLNLQSSIFVSRAQLQLGNITIHTADANLWSPRPDWEMLHAKRDDVLGGLKSCLSSWKSAEADSRNQPEGGGLSLSKSLPCIEQAALAPSGRVSPITNYLKRGLTLRGLRDTPFAKTAQGCSTTNSLKSQVFNPQFSNSLFSALANADISTARSVTSQLAGLGQGLTPSGDDFIMGAMYATWIIHPLDIARVIAEEIANTAAPLTTSLSAAWLESAGKGEAGILWHNFFDALVSTNIMNVQESFEKILAVGETSGADAMSGFYGTLFYWAESMGLHESLILQSQISKIPLDKTEHSF